MEPGLAHRALTGAISHLEWRTAIAETLAQLYGIQAAQRAVDAWSQVGVLNEEVVALIRRVRATTPVWLATNATTRLPADLATLGLDRELDGVVNSSAVGAAKPSEAFFAAALSLAGPVALFVDDSAGHCDAAARLMMPAHRFESIAGLETSLRQTGLLS
jgi:putative hydrolase of the HAD superfamily